MMISLAKEYPEPPLEAKKYYTEGRAGWRGKNQGEGV